MSDNHMRALPSYDDLRRRAERAEAELARAWEAKRRAESNTRLLLEAIRRGWMVRGTAEGYTCGFNWRDVGSGSTEAEAITAALRVAGYADGLQ